MSTSAHHTFVMAVAAWGMAAGALIADDSLLKLTSQRVVVTIHEDLMLSADYGAGMATWHTSMTAKPTMTVRSNKGDQNVVSIELASAGHRGPALSALAVTAAVVGADGRPAKIEVFLEKISRVLDGDTDHVRVRQAPLDVVQAMLRTRRMLRAPLSVDQGKVFGVRVEQPGGDHLVEDVARVAPGTTVPLESAPVIVTRHDLLRKIFRAMASQLMRTEKPGLAVMFSFAMGPSGAGRSWDPFRACSTSGSLALPRQSDRLH